MASWFTSWESKPDNRCRALWVFDLGWLLLLIAAAVLPFITPHVDLRVLSCFYHPETAHPWPEARHPFWTLLYEIGTWPALIVALTGLGIAVAAPYRRTLARWRRHALFLFLTLALGPGLFVNTIFKDHWGRPRPRQVTELGGTMEYQCFYEHGLPGRGKSFPCGHSSMGYYFIVFYFLARRKRRALRAALWLGAMAYGTLIGQARMAAGAHFLSDVLWSAVFPCLAAWVLYYFVLRIPQFEDTPLGMTVPTFWRSKWLVWVAIPLGLATLAAVLLATPAFTEINYDVRNPGQGTMRLRLRVDRLKVAPLQVNSNLHDRIVIQGEAHGFGWPWSRLRHDTEWTMEDGSPVLNFSFRAVGHFSELDGTINIEAPPGTVLGHPPPH